jgi:hypothetical protein
MGTDWNRVRAMMAAAIDACEQVEALGYSEQTRDRLVDVAGQKVSAFDIVTSAWVYPEKIRYAIITDRHDKGAALPYVPETARILVNMAEACAELIGAEGAAPASDAIDRMTRWYGEHAIPHLERALSGQLP